MTGSCHSAVLSSIMVVLAPQLQVRNLYKQSLHMMINVVHYWPAQNVSSTDCEPDQLCTQYIFWHHHCIAEAHFQTLCILWLSVFTVCCSVCWTSSVDLYERTGRVSQTRLTLVTVQHSAAGLIAGCPTTVVPFFGDQPFWGAACCRMGVGPKPIPIDKLDTPSLVEALQFMMRPEVQEAAKATGKGIEQVMAASVSAITCES